MSNLPTMKDLLEAGSHFGHEAKRWNPKMAEYIFTTRDKIHVIDLEKTEKKLAEAVAYIRDAASKDAQIVFLATKRQAQDFTKEQAQRVGVMYMTSRWVGGLFTNFETVRKTLKRFKEISDQKANAKEFGLTKKEQMLLGRHIDKVEKVLGGVKDMERMPDVMFVVDAKKELNGILEARKMGVKIVAICDTNSDPTLADYVIPANDDAIKSIQLIVKTIADAVEEGKNLSEKRKVQNEKLENAPEEKAVVAEKKSEAKVEKVTPVKVEKVEKAVEVKKEVKKETKKVKTETKKPVAKKAAPVKKTSKKEKK